MFPSHDGNGIFVEDSLVLSEAPSIYATGGLGLDGTRSITSEEDEEQDEEDDVRSVPASTMSSESESFWRGRRENVAPSSVGDSWALTEAALSTIPDADYPINLGPARAASVGLTSSDSSEDESFYNGVTPRPATRVGRRHPQSLREDPDEALLNNTPHAASAGLFRSGRKGYPSPPPEGLRGVKGGKRRHRRSGRTGDSQKKSSTSGSVGGQSATRRSAPTAVELAPAATEDEGKENLFLGQVMGKLLDIDTPTLDLISSAALPTPTQSRASSPVRYARRTQTSNRSPKSALSSHRGFAALSRHARFEIDGDAGQYAHFIDVDDEERMLVDDSGDETETELALKGSVASWYSEYIPPSSTSSSLSPSSTSEVPVAILGTQHRSKSLTSLPLPSSLTKPTPILRRTSSFSSSSSHGHSQTRARARSGEPQMLPWGGELDGLDAAVSYWRRILRTLRGF